MSTTRWVATLSCCAALAGCANWLTWDPPPEQKVQNQPEAEPTPERPVGPNDYMVRRGDTVYSIAFRGNLDYRELARWNDIGRDYLIRPGQVLRLRAPPPTQLVHGDIVSTPTQFEEPPAAAPTPLTSEVPPSTAPPPRPGDRRRSKRTPLPPAVAPPPIPAPVIATLPPPANAAPPPITSESGGPYTWQWPTQGLVVRGYDPASGSKGLDFSGRVGQPVVAAAPGKVVYSGAALKGYGELIIIKHDELRLSAYGYNRTRLVEEGQMVAGGQEIAELGTGPENKPVLHFEIRERGQPVNPVPYLPARDKQK
ncbi:MAG: peptidoglycan DD-metalloendopeptidase family protein [Panacagrimonas sp.]